MKAFLAALAVMAIMAVGADFALQNAGFSAAEVFQTESVRLGD